MAMPCVTLAATREFDPIAIARLVGVKPTPVLVSACAFLPITILSSLKDFAPLPIAIPFCLVTVLDGPMAIELPPCAPSLSTLLPVPAAAEFTDTYFSGLTALATAYNWDPLIASVLVADTSPAATFLICRVAPALPTETCIFGLPVAPAKL